ncbi:MAG: clan AA aspartic protease [Desulfuromonadaceae bacterium]|nr:clan AA aspartic protease [Desulfuromonadaceae bacterium]
MRMKRVFLSILFVLISTIAQAEFYRYTDDQGHMVVVDNAGRLPKGLDPEQHRLSEQTTRGSFSVVNTPHSPPPAPGTSVIPGFEQTSTPQLSASAATRVQIVGNKVIVPVTLQHKRKKIDLRLLLDTGASRTLLYRNSVDRLQLHSGRTIKGTLANGQQIKAKTTQLDLFTLGPNQFRTLDLLLIDTEKKQLGFDGLLGMDILRQLNYEIDFSTQRLIWHP